MNLYMFLKIKKNIVIKILGFFSVAILSVTVNNTFNISVILNINNKITQVDNEIDINIKKLNSNHYQEKIEELNVEIEKSIRLKAELEGIKSNINSLNHEIKSAVLEYVNGNPSAIKAININDLDLEVKNLSYVFFYKAKLEAISNASKDTVMNNFKKSIELDKDFDKLYTFANYLYQNEHIEEAIKYYKEALKYTNNILYRSMVLNELGLSYRIVMGSKYATSYLEESVKLKRQLVQSADTIMNRYYLANSLNNLAANYKNLQLYNEAIRAYDEALVIFRRDNYKLQEMIVLNGLGKLYSVLIFYNNKLFDSKYCLLKAEESFTQSLQISLELNNYKLVVDNYYEYAKLYINFFRIQENIDLENKIVLNLEKALEYNRNYIKDYLILKSNEAIIFSEYAHYYMVKNQFLVALNTMEEVLKVYRDLINFDEKKYLEEYLTQLYNYATLKIQISDFDGVMNKILETSNLLFNHSENIDFKINYLDFLCTTKCNMNLIKQPRYEKKVCDLEDELHRINNVYKLEYNCDCRKMKTFNGAIINSASHY